MLLTQYLWGIYKHAEMVVFSWPNIDHVTILKTVFSLLLYGWQITLTFGWEISAFFTFTGDITTFSIDRKKNASGEPNLSPVIQWYTRETEEQFHRHFVQILIITDPLEIFWEFRRHASEIIHIFNSTAFDLISYPEWNYLLISLVNIWSNLVPVKAPFPLAAGDLGKRLYLSMHARALLNEQS